MSMTSPSSPFPSLDQVLYSRLLLPHLACPWRAIAAWASQVDSSGLIFREEVEWISSSNPTVTAYVDIVEGFLAHQNDRLYIGAELGAMQPESSEKLSTSIQIVPVSIKPESTEDTAGRREDSGGGVRELQEGR